MNQFEWPFERTLIFDAAREVCVWVISMELKDGTHWLIFERPHRVLSHDGGMEDGVTLAIYASDADGLVEDWGARFEIEGPSSILAFRKFRYLYLNELITPIHAPATQPDEREIARLDAMFCDAE